MEETSKATLNKVLSVIIFEGTKVTSPKAKRGEPIFRRRRGVGDVDGSRNDDVPRSAEDEAHRGEFYQCLSGRGQPKKPSLITGGNKREPGHAQQEGGRTDKKASNPVASDWITVSRS